jgi:hypothetical protein
MKRTAYKTKTSRRSPRHAFLFRVGSQEPSKVWANVKAARSAVSITLTEDDVLRAAQRKGFGDAANCAGALCVYRHSDSFPHAVSGHFDFLERRLYVSDRNDAIGLPKSCVAYSHNDPVAKLFDSKAGLQKLLARLRKNGPMVIRLSPPVYQQRGAGRAKGAANAPPRRKTGAQGHKLRMTRVEAGWASGAAA